MVVARSTSLVDEGLEARVGGRQHGLLRDAAALKLDRNLRFLARADMLVQRFVGQGLLAMQAQQGFRQLGYELERDYVLERLGISHRLAQELMQVERALPRHPAVAQAYGEGRLCRSKVRLLLRQEKPDGWVEVATKATVRKLQEMLKTPEEHEDGKWLELNVTPQVAGKWERACEVVQRLNRAQTSPAECLEMCLAEMLAGNALRDPDQEMAETWSSGREEVLEAYRKLHATLEEETQQWCFLDWSTPEAEVKLALPEGASPWQIDNALRQAMRLQQYVQHFLMRLLRTLNTLHLTSDMMFSSIDHYVRERLGMASRTARTLIKLDRDLTERPQIDAAFQAGRITQTQAQLLVQIATEDSEAAWLAHADQVPTLQLKHDVAEACRIREADPTLDDVLPEEPRPMCAHERMRKLKIWIPAEVMPLWEFGVATVGADTDEACFEMMVDAFLSEWDDVAKKTEKAHPVATRDDWTCAIPTCSSRGPLEDHHIKFRSHGGDNTPANRIMLCHGHHHHGVHEGRVSVTGVAPHDLQIVLGVQRGQAPHQVFVGKRRVLAP